MLRIVDAHDAPGRIADSDETFACRFASTRHSAIRRNSRGDTAGPVCISRSPVTATAIATVSTYRTPHRSRGTARVVLHICFCPPSFRVCRWMQTLTRNGSNTNCQTAQPGVMERNPQCMILRIYRRRLAHMAHGLCQYPVDSLANADRVWATIVALRQGFEAEIEDLNETIEGLENRIDDLKSDAKSARKQASDSIKSAKSLAEKIIRASEAIEGLLEEAA